MPYSAFDLATVKIRLEQAQLAGYIYQHQQHILVLQEPFSDDGKPLNIYLQHELTGGSNRITVWAAFARRSLGISNRRYL